MPDTPTTPPETDSQAESTTMRFVSSGLAVVGVIIILIVVSWGIFNLIDISRFSFSFSSLFRSSTTTETLNGITSSPSHATLPEIPISTPAPVVVSPPPARLVSNTSKISDSADLSVKIIRVGYIDSSGALLTNRPIREGEVVGVEFDIANVGHGNTGRWYFEAHLPTMIPYTYRSPAQKSLAPGDHIVSTLRFTQFAHGLFTVIVDPSGTIRDINRANNEAAQVMY